MKNKFFTGLAILLPMGFTFAILIFLINLLTDPFLDIVQNIWHHLGLPDHQVGVFLSRMVILLFLIGFVLLIGFLARVFFINKLFSLGDNLIHRIPLVNKIYKTTQDMINTLFGSGKVSFSNVVLVPFPHSKAHCLGLMSGPSTTDQIPIFLPTALNPTAGFLLHYNANEIIYLDVKVEDAMKFVLSCGIHSTQFSLKEVK